MSRQTQTTQGTKAGIFGNLLTEPMQASKFEDKKGLSDFLDDVAKAPLMPVPDFDGIPYIETSLEIIKYYNKTPKMLKAFEDTGYFIFHNVRIYEAGKRDAIIAKMEKEEEERRLGTRL